MEPFTVTCATCESRLRVRNPGLVGQLVNCPKCSSMILIERPTAGGPGVAPGPKIEVAAGPGVAVDSMAVTKEALTDHVSGLSLPETPTMADDYRLAEVDNASPPTAPPKIDVASMYLDNWQADTPHVPSADWTSATSHRTQQYLLIAFLGLTGIAIAGVLFVLFLRWQADSDQASAVALQASETQASATTEETLEPVAETQTGETPLSAEGNAENTVENNTEIRTQNSTESDVVQTPDAPQPPTAPAIANTEPPTATDNLLSPTADASPPDAVPADSAQPEAAPSLPKRLAAFAPMLNFEIQPQFPDAIEVLSEPPVTAEDLGLATTVGLAEIPAVDLNAQYQLPISALVMAPLPLPQFVSVWSNLSGIPTSVDLDALAAAGFDHRQPLGINLAQSTTVGDLAANLGQAIGLEARPQENRYLRLTVPAEAIDAKLPNALPVAELVADQAAQQWLSEALTQLEPSAAGQWAIADGQLARPLAVDGQPLDPQKWFAVVRLLEGWRIAAGQSPTQTQYTPQQLSAKFTTPAEVPGLEQVLKQVSPQSRPVSTILPRICREANVHAWIDWPQVGAVGLGPQSTAVFVTAGRPLRNVLADYASEFSLVVAVLDEQSLWFTSNQAYRAAPRLFVIPSEGRSAEEWKSLLRQLTPTADGGNGVGSVVAVSTPDSQFILVRCCYPVVELRR